MVLSIPFLSQMDGFVARGAEYEHYAYGALICSFVRWAKTEHEEYMCSYVDAEGCVLNLGELISLQFKEIHVYVCELKPMIDAVLICCNKRRYLCKDIHWEQFASTVPEDGEVFTVVFAKFNQEIEGKINQTIL